MFEVDDTKDEIFTERLRLRRPRDGDAESIYLTYSSVPEVTRFVAWPMHQSLREAEQFILYSESEWQRWPSRSLSHQGIKGIKGIKGWQLI